jgi:hypothetical protein
MVSTTRSLRDRCVLVAKSSAAPEPPESDEFQNAQLMLLTPLLLQWAVGSGQWAVGFARHGFAGHGFARHGLAGHLPVPNLPVNKVVTRTATCDDSALPLSSGRASSVFIGAIRGSFATGRELDQN